MGGYTMSMPGSGQQPVPVGAIYPAYPGQHGLEPGRLIGVAVVPGVGPSGHSGYPAVVRNVPNPTIPLLRIGG